MIGNAMFLETSGSLASSVFVFALIAIVRAVITYILHHKFSKNAVFLAEPRLIYYCHNYSNTNTLFLSCAAAAVCRCTSRTARKNYFHDQLPATMMLLIGVRLRIMTANITVFSSLTGEMSL